MGRGGGGGEEEEGEAGGGGAAGARGGLDRAPDHRGPAANAPDAKTDDASEEELEEEEAWWEGAAAREGPLLALRVLEDGSEVWVDVSASVVDDTLRIRAGPAADAAVVPLRGSAAEEADLAGGGRCVSLTTAAGIAFYLRSAREAGGETGAGEDRAAWVAALRAGAAVTVSTKYSLRTVLGRGSFSEVRLGVHRATGREVAVKVVQKTGLGDERHRLLNEIAVMKRARHRNVVRLYEVFETQRHIYLVQQHLAGGELFDRVMERGRFTEHDASLILRDLCRGVRALHAAGIVHRDLKPENLMFEDASEHARLRIADFGLSKFYRGAEAPAPAAGAVAASSSSSSSSSSASLLLRTACGTPGYVAPEIARGKAYGALVDMWSVGVILYVLLCGYPPFSGSSDGEILDAIRAGRYVFEEGSWGIVSDSAKHLVSRLLSVNPADRLTADQVLRHPWVAEEGVARRLHLSSVSQQLRARSRWKHGVNFALSVARFRLAGARHHSSSATSVLSGASSPGDASTPSAAGVSPAPAPALVHAPVAATDATKGPPVRDPRDLSPRARRESRVESPVRSPREPGSPTAERRR